jgi:hypothetical protein
MYIRKQERLGMTAIAAVLALSSTSLAAQETTGTDVPLVNVPAPEPVAPAADPLAPVPEAAEATPAETTATTGAAPVAAKPVAKKTAAKTQASVKQTAKASVPAAAAPTTAATSSAPIVEARPPEAPVAEAAPAPIPEAAPVQQADAGPKIDEAIPLAGGAGAVILALAGAGMAIRRRKRHEDEEGEYQDELAATDEVQPEAEPIWDPPVVQPRAAPIAATTTDGSEDFDTSRFGCHVQAAYAGPTPKNPSLSLRTRLKLAGELDRRERLHGTAPDAAASIADSPAEPKGFMLSGTAPQARTQEYQF